MATGAAAQITRNFQLHFYAKWLVIIAFAEALFITVSKIYSFRTRHSKRQIPTVGKNTSRESEVTSGLFTIPLGLAVISTGLISTELNPLLQLGYATFFACCASYAVLLFQILVVQRCNKIAIQNVDGGLFLIPAAGFGIGITLVVLVPRIPPQISGPVAVASITLVTFSTLGYFYVIVLSALGIRRFALSSTRKVLWWIGAGCGGLGALSTAKQLALRTIEISPTLQHLLRILALTMWSLGTLILIPIALLSIQYLFRLENFPKNAPWPPTFSTAVYALGTITASQLIHSQAVHLIGVAASIITLLLWSCTVMLITTQKLSSGYLVAKDN